LTSSVSRNRKSAGVKPSGGVSPNTNITYPTNLDSPLLDYSSKNFINDLNIYLNGILLMPGVDQNNPNDVYPGVNQATGDLKFPMKLRSGSIISVEVF
jgi:hypothetical protein